jgi:hypothetical protein
MRLSITGRGDFWQSDDFAASSTGTTPVLVNRRIQKYLATTDNFIGQQQEVSSELAVCISFQPPRKRDFDLFQALRSTEIGKWLTLELNVQEERVVMYFSEERI